MKSAHHCSFSHLATLLCFFFVFCSLGLINIGEGSSNLVPLTVRYTPVCRYPLRNIRGAERGEFLNLSCSVDALPLPLKYRYD
jgi:hypothetical protein